MDFWHFLETETKSHSKSWCFSSETGVFQQNIRTDFIEHSFEERTGFLMPYPGKKVATDPNFKGSINDMEEQFTQHLEEFVPLMLSPNNLIIKKIGGSEVNGYSLFLYFTVYSNKFSGSELPEPKSLLEATAEANNLIAVATALNHYSTKMEEICGGDHPYQTRNSLQANHLKIKEEALQVFDRTPKMGGKEFSERHRNDLIRRIEDRFKYFEAQNASKDFFRRFRRPLYILLTCFVTFFLYYLASATGLTPLAHMFFIVSTICLGLFVTYVMHLRDGHNINMTEAIVVSVLMSLISLFLLYWKHIWYFFQQTVQTRQQRYELY